jgi:hypothetical protein
MTYLQAIWAFLAAHSMTVQWALVAIVTSMPSPGVDGAPTNWLYRWFFSLAHIVVGALSRAGTSMRKQSLGLTGAVKPPAPPAPPGVVRP